MFVHSSRCVFEHPFQIYLSFAVTKWAVSVSVPPKSAQNGWGLAFVQATFLPIRCSHTFGHISALALFTWPHYMWPHNGPYHSSLLDPNRPVKSTEEVLIALQIHDLAQLLLVCKGEGRPLMRVCKHVWWLVPAFWRASLAKQHVGTGEVQTCRALILWHRIMAKSLEECCFGLKGRSRNHHCWSPTGVC